MDALEPLQVLHTRTAVETVRRPLVPAIERTNGITPRRSRSREVSPKYKSPTPPYTSANSGRRCQSRNITRTISSASSLSSTLSSASSHSGSRRLVSPVRPSTPVSDTVASADTQLSNMKITDNERLHGVLWPSTMRSLSVSFQSDCISIPVIKKEKQVSHKPSCNVALKPSPERRRSPLKGRNLDHQSENSRPVDGLQSKVTGQHLWPTRMRSRTLTESIDLHNKTGKQPSIPVGKSMRRLSTESIPKPLHNASNDAEEHDSSIPGSGLPSLSRIFSSKSSLSPFKTRSSRPAQTRGISPSRVIRQSVNTTSSVLGFIADVKKSKKTNHLEDVHHVRISYNRFLQWRFANARVDAAMFIQIIASEQTLYNVWQANSKLWDSVIKKRIELERLKSELNLNLVLKKQIGYLDDWASFEIGHTASLCGLIKDLKCSTLRLPVTGGAKANVDSLKAAIDSAIDVVQAMDYSICTLLSKVDGMSSLVSELSELAGQERSMLNECDNLLASTTAMQVTEYSLRTQLVQSQQNISGNSMQTLLRTP